MKPTIHTPELYDVSNAAALADSLGKARAQLASAKLVVKGLEDIVKASGVAEIEGEHYRVTVSRSERQTTDWKSVAFYLKPSSQLVAGHTTKSSIVAVRVGARKK
jgi:hypothetical protein